MILFGSVYIGRDILTDVGESILNEASCTTRVVAKTSEFHVGKKAVASVQRYVLGFYHVGYDPWLPTIDRQEIVNILDTCIVDRLFFSRTASMCRGAGGCRALLAMDSFCRVCSLARWRTLDLCHGVSPGMGCCYEGFVSEQQIDTCCVSCVDIFLCVESRKLSLINPLV